MSLRRFLSLPLILALALLPAACTLLPEQQAQRSFVLASAQLSSSDATALPLVLRLQTPQAGMPLAGSRIAVQAQPHEISVYAGVRWADNAPTLLRDHLIDAFQRTARLGAVISDDSSARSELTLASQLGAFHAVYHHPGDKAPHVRVRLDVQLIHSGSRRVLASRRFEQELPSADARVETVVEAFSRAGDALARELVDWTLAQAAQAQQAGTQ